MLVYLQGQKRHLKTLLAQNLNQKLSLRPCLSSNLAGGSLRDEARLRRPLQGTKRPHITSILIVRVFFRTSLHLVGGIFLRILLHLRPACRFDIHVQLARQPDQVELNIGNFIAHGGQFIGWL